MARHRTTASRPVPTRHKPKLLSESPRLSARRTAAAPRARYPAGRPTDPPRRHWNMTAGPVRRRHCVTVGWSVALRDITDRKAVLRAMAEADEMVNTHFFTTYGFGESRRYRIINQDKTYPSRPSWRARSWIRVSRPRTAQPHRIQRRHPDNNKSEELGFEILPGADDLGLALRASWSSSKKRLVNHSQATIRLLSVRGRQKR